MPPQRITPFAASWSTTWAPDAPSTTVNVTGRCAPSAPLQRL